MTLFLNSKYSKAICMLFLLEVISVRLPHELFACWGDGGGCTDDCCDSDPEGEEDGASVRTSKTSCANCSATNHVIESSGNLYLQIRPFKLKGIGLPIEPVLTYNSKGEKGATPYGRGWVLNYDRRIKILDAEKTKIECEDGRGNLYTYNLNTGTYTAKKRRHQRYS